VIEITQELVVDCWDFMNGRFGARVADKESADDMIMVADFLHKFGVLDRDRFMLQYTTTVQNVIYTPFVVGDASTMPLLNQLHLCVHEHQHVHQWNEGGGDFIIEYAADPDKRAKHEAEALRSNMELDYWLGRTRPVYTRVSHLKDYALHDDHIATVLMMLKMATRTVNRGGIETDSGKVLIAYLNSLTG
jgi:hypothetical protein